MLYEVITLELLREEGAEDDPPDGVPLVEDRLGDVAAAGEAVDDLP